MKSDSRLKPVKHLFVPGFGKKRPELKKPVAKLEDEIEPTLSHMNPEIQEEIRDLAFTGHTKEAEEELIDYVITDDHFEKLREEQQESIQEEPCVHFMVYVLAAIPTLIALYFILQLLFTGRISLP